MIQYSVICLRVKMSDNEHSLIDEEEDLSQYLGSLSFAEERQTDESTDQPRKNTEKDDPKFSTTDLPRSPKLMSSNIYFEVTDAKIITEIKSKYVMYTILIKSSSLDMSPVSVERRYSDFEKLHSSLKKLDSAVMSDIAFPRKQLLGNFKAQTIAERSRSFEGYMSHIATLHHIHFSNPIKQFFYGDFQEKALIFFQSKQYSNAVPLFRRIWLLQKKLYGDVYEDTVNTLSALTVCFLELDSSDKAQVCSESVIRCLKYNENSELLVPMLQVSIRLCWKLGKDKKDLEQQLLLLKKDCAESCSSEQLREMVLKNYTT